MVDKDGKVKNAGKALLVHSIGTSFGALMGTSTVTTYVESSEGVAEGLPAFITIALMPMTYSIGDGLTLGILSYVIRNMINNITSKNPNNRKSISPVMYVLAFLFIVKLVVTGGH